MEILAHFFLKIIQFAGFLLDVYTWIIIARAVISWVNADPYNPIVRFIYEVTEPLMGRIRQMLPLSVAGIDFSPIILIMAIMFFQSVVLGTLQQLVLRFV